MALTTPRGFSGGPMSDIDYGIDASGPSWVESAAALAVSQPNAGVRTVSVAAGNLDAFGIRVTNDAALTQAITAPSSGGAWYLIAVRFNWSARTCTLQALPGPTTGSTTTPTAIPATLPATITSTPGTSYDAPLAWVFVSSATTTATLFDVRMTRSGRQAYALTPDALTVLGLQLPPLAGGEVPCANGATYRWNGTAWKIWHWSNVPYTTFGALQNGAQSEVAAPLEVSIAAGVLTLNFGLTLGAPDMVFGTTYLLMNPGFRPPLRLDFAAVALAGTSSILACILAVDGSLQPFFSTGGAPNSMRGTISYRPVS